MNTIQIIEVFIAGVGLIGSYFGIPKLVGALDLKRQKNTITSTLKKLEEELKQIRGKGRGGYIESRVFINLKNHLWKAKKVFKNKEFLQEQLDRIISDLNKVGADDQIQEMRAKFEDYFEFSPRSWAYIAISNMNLYRLDGMNEYREYCLEACKESIKRLPNYGIPRAVILILYMIDYVRKKQIDKDVVLNKINQINSGDDMLVSRETYNYIIRCKKIKEWGKYIEPLVSLYPREMEEMKNRCELQKKPVLVTEKESPLFADNIYKGFKKN